MAENLWRHIPSNTTWAFCEEDRDANGHPFAVMEPRSAGGLTVIVDAFSARMRINPLDLYERDGDWEKA